MLLRLFLLLSLLISYSSAVTYRCDDDQIIVVQSFGNDTIRMHCQKPILCGLQFLKCRYNHLQRYCGGKTNFAAHIQQISPISPVMHTCCNLMVNEDVQIKMHTGNDCFLYDLPDGSTGITAEQLEKQDHEGYSLLKNYINESEQFANFSGYRLRLFLLRNKKPSQFVVKGVERNEAGYRVTICSIQCKNDIEKVQKVIDDKKDANENEKQPIVNGSQLNHFKVALENLTNDGQVFFVSWTKWSHKQWSEWSTERKIELDGINRTKERDHRLRIHHIGKGRKISKGIKGSIPELGKGYQEIHKKGNDDCDDEEKMDKNKENLETFDRGDNNKELLQVKQREMDSQEKLKTESKVHKNLIGREEESIINQNGEMGKKTENITSSTQSGQMSSTKNQTGYTTISIASTTGDMSSFEIQTSETTTQTSSTMTGMSTLEIQIVSETISPVTSRGRSNLSSLAIQSMHTTTPTKSTTDGMDTLRTQTSSMTSSAATLSESNLSSSKIQANHTTTPTRSTTGDISTLQTQISNTTIFPVTLSASNLSSPEIQANQTTTPIMIVTTAVNGIEIQTNHTRKKGGRYGADDPNAVKNATKTKKARKNDNSNVRKKASDENRLNEKKSATEKSDKQKTDTSGKVESRKENKTTKKSDRKGVVSFQPRQQQPPLPPVEQQELKMPGLCFSEDTTVYTQSGKKTMKDLSIGDFVLVPISKNQLKYERVEMFYHREPDTQAKFVVLETESGKKLSLTELHLLPLGDCKEMRKSMIDKTNVVEQWLRKSKFAHKARVGDCVFTMTTNHELQVDPIVKIGRKYLKGVYSPMTVEGSIVVDGVFASCFSQVESHFSQKLIYDILIYLYRIFGPFMQSLDEPIQHLPTFIDSIHYLSHYAVPFVKY